MYQTTGDNMNNYLDLALQAYRNGTMDTRYEYFAEVATLSKLYTDLNCLYIEIDELQDAKNPDGSYVNNLAEIQRKRQAYRNLQEMLHAYEEYAIPLICKQVLK
jgi:endonuclease IV